jgi:zinc transporter ZupT
VSFAENASKSLGISVMAALMIHKIPEAFGFGSFMAFKRLPRP